MKKTLVSALTTALVVGAASTTFAAANPFADVPADHWAYDAVSQLADAGIVDGYLDGAFKGDQGMSRYEMAQIVAKAMTKSDKADAANKAMIDKLAAEFGDELANLGVRVDALEKKTDNVIWKGLVRYDWNNMNYAQSDAHAHQADSNIKLRLEPTFAINENWTGHARIDATLRNDQYSTTDEYGHVDDSAGMSVKRLWTNGKYGKFDIKLGRFGSYSDASHGLVMDENVTGAELAYAPTSEWKVKATVSHMADSDTSDKFGVAKASVRYGAVEVDYNNGKLDAGVGYHQFALDGIGNGNLYAADKKNIGVVDFGVGYKFDKKWSANADYAVANSFDDRATYKNANHNAYKVHVQYGGADAKVAKTWGAWVEYKSLSPAASPFTAGDLNAGFAGLKTLKGWEIGADYTFAKNVVGTVKYFMGKDTAAPANKDDKTRGIFTRVDFLF